MTAGRESDQMHDFIGLEQHAKSPLEAAASGADGEARDAAADDVRFLQGPQPRGFELGKAFEIFCELMRGFRTFHFLAPCVTVFGSARLGGGVPALCSLPRNWQCGLLVPASRS